MTNIYAELQKMRTDGVTLVEAMKRLMDEKVTALVAIKSICDVYQVNLISAKEAWLLAAKHATTIEDHQQRLREPLADALRSVDEELSEDDQR